MPRLVSSACPWPARRFKRTVFGVSYLTCPLWLLRTRAQGCGGEGSYTGCVGDGTSQAPYTTNPPPPGSLPAAKSNSMAVTSLDGPKLLGRA